MIIAFILFIQIGFMGTSSMNFNVSGAGGAAADEDAVQKKAFAFSPINSDF